MLCAQSMMGLMVIAGPAPAQDTRIELRYDLRPGDHLTYRQQLDREMRSDEGEFLVHAEWVSHVLVVASDVDGMDIGIQRNRLSAELVRYRENGKDRLDRERKNYAEQLKAWPAAFAEANRITPIGLPLLPWSAAREYRSEILFAIHEVEGLAGSAVRTGDTWRGTNVLDFTFRVVGSERVKDADCLRIEGKSSLEGIQLILWFCPSTGVLTKLEFQGSMPASPVKERLTIELTERRRDEAVQSWLSRPDLREGALEAIAICRQPPVEIPSLYALLDPADPTAARRILGLAYRLRSQTVPVERLAKLFDSDDALLRRLVIRCLETAPTSAAHPIIARALEDSDRFVAASALAWCRARLPAGEAERLTTAKQILGAWQVIADQPLPRPSDQRLSSAVAGIRAGKTDPTWSCSTAGGPAEALRVQIAPPAAPGTTVRPMSTAAFRGWPYVIHVPEDYRGDEPFPLLVYLSGGPGRAVAGALDARSTLNRTGYIVVFPQAQQAWWTETTARLVESLVEEVEREHNIDPNRIYVAGSSNGGSGAFYFAAAWPHRIAAVVSLMGAGLYAPAQQPPLPMNMAHVPLLFVHGDRDPVVPVGSTTDTVERLRQVWRAAPTETRILKGREHDIALDRDDGLTEPFLAKYVRDPYPRHVRFQADSTALPRHYWVELVEKKEGTAEVEGEIRDDNSIRLTARNVARIRLLLRRELLPGGAGTPIRVTVNGKNVFEGPLAEDCGLLQSSWIESADPFLAYSMVIDVPIPR